jgi:hypothetical protein
MHVKDDSELDLLDALMDERIEEIKHEARTRSSGSFGPGCNQPRGSSETQAPDGSSGSGER